MIIVWISIFVPVCRSTFIDTESFIYRIIKCDKNGLIPKILAGLKIEVGKSSRAVLKEFNELRMEFYILNYYQRAKLSTVYFLQIGPIHEILTPIF